MYGSTETFYGLLHIVLSTFGCDIVTTIVRKFVERGPCGSRPAPLARGSLRRARGVEKAGIGRGGVEEATLIWPAPPLALSLIHGRQGLDGWGIADTWLEVGAAGVHHVGPGGSGHWGGAVHGGAGYLVVYIAIWHLGQVSLKGQVNTGIIESKSPLRCTASTDSTEVLAHRF